MPYFPKHWTLEEARGALPWVRERLHRLQECVRELERRGMKFFGNEPVELEITDVGFSRNGDGSHDFPLEYLEFLRILDDFTRRGIWIKSAREGLIDFPAITPWGEEVLLCYLDGEEDIRYWHTLQGGFAGRRPVQGTFGDPEH